MGRLQASRSTLPSALWMLAQCITCAKWVRLGWGWGGRDASGGAEMRALPPLGTVLPASAGPRTSSSLYPHPTPRSP